MSEIEHIRARRAQRKAERALVLARVNREEAEAERKEILADIGKRLPLRKATLRPRKDE